MLGEIYQILLMPETKDKTLEEIDLVFEKSTMEIMRENIASTRETVGDLVAGRWGKVFRPVPRGKSIN